MENIYCFCTITYRYNGFRSKKKSMKCSKNVRILRAILCGPRAAVGALILGAAVFELWCSSHSDVPCALLSFFLFFFIVVDFVIH